MRDGLGAQCVVRGLDEGIFGGKERCGVDRGQS